MIKSKKGIQLAVNFVVILILSITLLTLGIYFLQKLVDVGTNTITEIDAELERQILDEMMSKGDAVFMPEAAKTIRLGDFDNFIIGVTNIGVLNADGEIPDFWLEIKVAAVDVAGAPIPNPGLMESGPNPWITYVTDRFKLEPDEGKARQIGIEPILYDDVNWKKGQYAFDAYVCTDNTDSGTPGSVITACNGAYIYPPVQRFYVNVK